jgi:hypothetical protein
MESIGIVKGEPREVRNWLRPNSAIARLNSKVCEKVC